MSHGIVIVGAGHAGATAATSLREYGWSGAIRLIGEEPGEPYQRPPLSKGHLAGTEGESDLVLRAHGALRRDDIDYMHGTRVISVDRSSRRVILHSGEEIGYDTLVLATGSRARPLPIPGAGLRGVHTLRTRADSRELRQCFDSGRRFVVAGGGFLGLEAAATAARTGIDVTVLERSSALLHRVVGATIADHLAQVHRSHGVDIRLDVTVESFAELDGGVQRVDLAAGDSVPADAVLVAVGGIADTELAENAGLEVTDGVVVDEHLRSSDEYIFAIGDCVRFPSIHAGASIRLESVQNATDQARHVAGEVTGRTSGPYAGVPWFWSHQYDRNLQIAGIALPTDSEIALEPTRESGLAVARHRAGRIVAVESVNDPRIHLKARRLLSYGPVDIGRLSEIAQPFEALVR